MNKQEFLTQLKKGLRGLPKSDVEERLNFYGEMIDDRIEEGFSEEDAVRDIGNIDELVAQIIADIPLTKLVKERIKFKRKLNVGEILALILGSPVWVALLIVTVAVVLAVYVSLWAVIISLWAVFICMGASVIACVAMSIYGAFFGNKGIPLVKTGIIWLLLCAGLMIFLYFGCDTATKGILAFTKKFTVLIKNRFIRKEKTV